MLQEVFFQLLNDLQRDEGCKLNPYTDTVGKLSIGIGRNLTDRGITQTTALQMVTEDIEEAYQLTRAIFPLFGSYSKPRQRALLNMMFNLGATRFLGFSLMIQAVKEGDFEKAATEALNSQWAIQVGERSNRIANLLKTA